MTIKTCDYFLGIVKAKQIYFLALLGSRRQRNALAMARNK